MGLHVILYGPRRGPEKLLGVLTGWLKGAESIVVVRYAGTEPGDTLAGDPRVRAVFVEDPGPFPVEEKVGRGLIRRVGASNGRRQFVMIRAGLAELSGLPGTETVLVVRSDLDVHNEDTLRQFLRRAERSVAAGAVRFVRLTVNPMSPFSFTGHKLHGSDWLFVTTLYEARRLILFDPAMFSAGTYRALDWIRKGDFCFGAFSAEQIFNLGAYLNTTRLRDRGCNALTLPWSAAIRFLRDNLFVRPADAGVGLAKWQYLYDLKMTLPHPFGPSLRGEIRRLCAWLLFWSELVPPSGPGFAAKLAAKALVSWSVHSIGGLRRTRHILLQGSQG